MTVTVDDAGGREPAVSAMTNLPPTVREQLPPPDRPSQSVGDETVDSSDSTSTHTVRATSYGAGKSGRRARSDDHFGLANHPIVLFTFIAFAK